MNNPKEDVSTSLVRQVESLRRSGSWQALRALAPAYIASLTGHDRAKVHAALSTAFYHTASGRHDYRQALKQARLCLVYANPNSLLHIWSYHKIAGLSVILGRYAVTAAYAVHFLKWAALYPELKTYVPYVLRDLSHVYYRRQHYRMAERLLQRAQRLFAAFGQEEEVIRTQCNLVWAQAAAGRIEEAYTNLPCQVSKQIQHLLDGALCALYYAKKQYRQAYLAGESAMVSGRAAHDCVDAAEVVVILAKIKDRQGCPMTAKALTDKAAELSVRQGHSLLALVANSCRVESTLAHHKTHSLAASERCGASLTTGVG